MLTQSVLSLIFSFAQLLSVTFNRADHQQCGKFDEQTSQQSSCTCNGSTMVSCKSNFQNENLAILNIINQKFERIDKNFVFTDFSKIADRVYLYLEKLPLKQLTTSLLQRDGPPRECPFSLVGSKSISQPATFPAKIPPEDVLFLQVCSTYSFPVMM